MPYLHKELSSCHCIGNTGRKVAAPDDWRLRKLVRTSVGEWEAYEVHHLQTIRITNKDSMLGRKMNYPVVGHIRHAARGVVRDDVVSVDQGISRGWVVDHEGPENREVHQEAAGNPDVRDIVVRGKCDEALEEEGDPMEEHAGLRRI